MTAAPPLLRVLSAQQSLIRVHRRAPPWKYRGEVRHGRADNTFDSGAVFLSG
ncbi:hypothetical protein LO772_00055 [Yinghuangia sp. ASG 101]|uniref:hypothetical protein n=1 Tax=Yinghuangia sp. ASG 101 TaxID=2896848 RepID=UPI001E4F2D05|nr:hypothetical protein [Yinghuangia sp. ASG 101]UGQ12047.1 hypothetical protein LO772_00055 [Yinghuangia sp. ASG 101]